MGVSRTNGNRFRWNKNCFSMETVLQTQWNSSYRSQMHEKYRTKNHFKVSATLVPDLDHKQKRLFINDLIPCLGTQGNPKRSNTKCGHSLKQIIYQYTNVCHMVKTLERETVHGPSQIATWSNLLCKRKKVTWSSHNRSTRQGPSMLFK